MSRIGLFIGGRNEALEAQCVNDLLLALNLPQDGRGIAIAVNDAVVSRSRWLVHELHDGDRIEIVRAVQGG